MDRVGICSGSSIKEPGDVLDVAVQGRTQRNFLDFLHLSNWLAVHINY